MLFIVTESFFYIVCDLNTLEYVYLIWEQVVIFTFYIWIWVSYYFALSLFFFFWKTEKNNIVFQWKPQCPRKQKKNNTTSSTLQSIFYCFIFIIINVIQTIWKKCDCFFSIFEWSKQKKRTVCNKKKKEERMRPHNHWNKIDAHPIVVYLFSLVIRCSLFTCSMTGFLISNHLCSFSFLLINFLITFIIFCCIKCVRFQ